MLPQIKGARLPKPPWSEFTLDYELIYYDGPRLLLQKSVEGRLFLAWWHDEESLIERWIYLPVSEERLRAILSGEIADRHAMDNPEDGYIYVVDWDWEKDEIEQVVKTTTIALPQDALPHPDVRLSIPIPEEIGDAFSGKKAHIADNPPALRAVP